ncbi:MAG TPA: NeuD/PglB/VioB family sugar acetyltransferase [Anaerolineales bacterium]|nr:NeuD/PglB/VioB family sugar acetyltransferase [Anaerolineales bacterium]HRQ92355.1 NeuD/PglB/VioB family sugar acetyltransferase [Anaerolineales bacterium]
MSQAQAVHVPLINPNETEARLVSVAVANGDQVAKGDVLAMLETTKSTFELLADSDGYVAGLSAQAGQMLPAGQVFLYLAPSKEWQPAQTQRATDSEGVPAGLRITQPALQLAHKRNIPLGSLPVGPIITEEYIAKLAGKDAGSFIIPDAASAPDAVIVYGGGGHGKAVIDLLRAAGGYVLAGVVDDSRQPGELVLDTAVIGGEPALAALRQAGCQWALNAVGGIGAMSSRIAVFEKLEAGGFQLPTLIHPSAVIEPSAQLGAGVQVFPHAYIGSEARIGKGVIINTGAIVSHDCVIEDFANLSPGSILAGSVQVGRGSLIGMGVTVNLNVRIGSMARIGNTATVKEHVPGGGVVRAGAVWPS